jgi:16S rRNA (uracil1498-N3)-methyltransferase
MPRFFVTKEMIQDGFATISGNNAYHIGRSLRMAVGDEIYVSDGEGKEYLAKLTKIRDEECTAEIISESASSEPEMSITLYMAYPKGDKLETVIQKAVELGATRIVPFESSRCIKRPKADKVAKQGERLSKIAEEAAKQCGRCIVPEVALPLSYSAMLKDIETTELKLICYEKESDHSIKELLTEKKPKSIAIIVGCEGGFSSEEVDEAINAGCHSVTLGKRILRCETAPSAVLSMILYQYEM